MTLARLVGTWFTEATHPAMPGVVVHGVVTVEWLEGQRFLIHRGRSDHAEFPDSISIIGDTTADRAETATAAADASPRLTMHYYDSRGVFREYEASITGDTWRISRTAPGMSQRFTGTFTDGGDTIDGLWQMSDDDTRWTDDLKITYRRNRK